MLKILRKGRQIKQEKKFEKAKKEVEKQVKLAKSGKMELEIGAVILSEIMIWRLSWYA